MTKCQTAAALAADGLTPAQIADRLGVSKHTVHDRLRYAAKKRRPIQVPEDALDALKAQAAARSVSVTVLARNLLIATARDDLVAAVLDDDPSRQQIEGMG